jgi:hypothetical protein
MRSVGNDNAYVPNNEVTCIIVQLHFAGPWVSNSRRFDLIHELEYALACLGSDPGRNVDDFPSTTVYVLQLKRVKQRWPTIHFCNARISWLLSAQKHADNLYEPSDQTISCTYQWPPKSGFFCMRCFVSQNLDNYVSSKSAQGSTIIWSRFLNLRPFAFFCADLRSFWIFFASRFQQRWGA